MDFDFNKVEYFTIVVFVPQTHADLIRDVMAKNGAGESDHYSHGSFSVTGISRFKPKEGSNAFIGEIGKVEKVVEDRIETICHKSRLLTLIEALKEAHPYEEIFFDVLPVYNFARKHPFSKGDNIT